MKKITIILTVFAAILLAGCDLKQDVAPMPTFIGEANTTIAELLAMHTIGSEDSFDSIPIGSNIIICGYVTTSDEWGNNYKYINIEDSTGGIQIKIDNKALYNRYKVGERIYVKCDGLVLGDYRKLPQLGLWANGAMQPIPSFKTYLYIFPDGAPVGEYPAIDMTTIPAANNIPSTMYNCRVRLIGATFVEGGMATFSDPGASTSHDIKMADGTTITMRTSNYATFANEILPVGTGDITGISPATTITCRLSSTTPTIWLASPSPWCGRPSSASTTTTPSTRAGPRPAPAIPGRQWSTTTSAASTSILPSTKTTI